jgi:hypothetical protein
MLKGAFFHDIYFVLLSVRLPKYIFNVVLPSNELNRILKLFNEFLKYVIFFLSVRFYMILFLSSELDRWLEANIRTYFHPADYILSHEVRFENDLQQVDCIP